MAENADLSDAPTRATLRGRNRLVSRSMVIWEGIASSSGTSGTGFITPGSPRQAKAAGDQAPLDVVGAAADHVHDRVPQAVLEGAAAGRAGHVAGQGTAGSEDVQQRLA